ncbi:MAG TPA: vWA domain-containing protein, partial [Polyangiaceae bacterium]|nr:vWA domain-containing protein [Polyangiaceae bacterium]
MALVWLAGCGAAGNDGQSGVSVRPDQQGPSTGDGTPPPQNMGDPNAPGTGSMGPDFNVSEDDPDGLTPMGCQQAEREFVPNIPTVYLLVDRSGTMFDPIIDNVSAWTALRGGVLDVMRELQDNVRFGFAAFAGATLPGQMCDLQVPSVAPKLNNYEDIAALYQPLERPTNPNEKETPTTLALARIAAELRADTTTIGDKYILFVTDGEPDYCDNGNQLCPPDSVVGLLQGLASGVDATGAPVTPIRTLVFGVSSPTASIRADVLQAFANAGAGLPVMAIAQNANQVANPNDMWDQCNGVVGWRSDFTNTGKPNVRGESIGDYVFDATLAGKAPVYRPDPTDQAA